MAPNGTVTVKPLAVAAVTVALVAPKKTTLFSGVASKLEPEMVTLVPIAPFSGVKEVIIGGAL